MNGKIDSYFHGTMSPGDEIAEQKWLAEHGFDSDVTEDLETLFNEGYTHKRDTHGIAVFWTAAASFAALIVAFTVIFSSIGRKDATWTEYTAAIGQTETMELPDGSVICLNAGTKVIYPSRFDGHERKIFVDGEVYAHISSDKRRPFIISSGDVRLKVLGTTFDFKSYRENECVEVRLIEGSVELDMDIMGKESTMKMVPGSMVQYDRKSGKVDMQSFDLAHFRSFESGRIINFYGISMRDIAKDLTRVFGSTVVVEDEKLANTHILALFTNGESLDQILDALNRDNKMTITRKDGVTYLKSI